MTTSRFEGSRPIIRPFHGISPKIHASAWVAPGAVVVGDVEIGPDSSVWYASVLRGDVHSIRIGARSNLQDHCVVHVTRGRYCCEVGDEVTVGHRATIHGCRVEDAALIGIGSIVLDGAHVGEGAIVAAALEYAAGKGKDDQLIVVVIPSFGERYIQTKLFDPYRYEGSDDVHQ